MSHGARKDEGPAAGGGASAMVDRGDRSVRVEVRGPVRPEGVAPVLLLHGLLTSTDAWVGVAPSLPRSRRIVVPDLCGHGGSPGASADVSLDELVDDLLAILDRLDMARAILVGLSLGGLVCLRAAVRAPERVEALALVATPLEPEPADARARRLGTLDAMRRLGNRRVLRGMGGWLFGATTRRRRPDVVERWLESLDDADPVAIRRTAHAALSRPDARPWLDEVRVPRLVAFGGEDALVPPDRGAAWARGEATVAVVPEAGHLVPLEQPEVLGQVLARWIDSLECPPSPWQGGRDARTVA